ncbi:MAG: peptidoglycan D,D-transpeptidase FtsI family protein [Phycisphaerae bacterium]
MRSGWYLFAIAGVLLLGGAGRLVQLEYAKGSDLRTLGAKQQTATFAIAAQRGDVLDARGRVLAGSVRRPSIFVDGSLVSDPRFAAASIAPVLGLRAAALEKQLIEKKDDLFQWVKRSLSDAEVEAFRELRRTRNLKAFDVQFEPHRVYPYKQLAAQVIGFVGAEQNGLAGIEQSFEKHLLGIPGKRSATVDMRRRRLQDIPDGYHAPIDGSSVILTIDAHLQQRAEYHLKNAVTQFKAKWGTAVLMDPQTGEILAMATYPSFDPAEPMPSGPMTKEQEEEAREHLRNRAITDSYEPGSIFKPFIVGPALDQKLVSLDEVLAINGPTRQFGGRTIHDTHAYDRLAIWEVISKSSNIGMGILGSRIGNDKLHRIVRLFGFGDQTGVPLTGEHHGLVQDYSRWGPFSTQSIPIGQEIAITPIQMLTAFSVFCNDGMLMRPRIVRGVVNHEGETIEDYSQPVAIRRVISPESAQLLRHKALAEVVISGTGKKAAIPDYQVFGKTGTAQIARENGRGYLPNTYVGSFVAGAPLSKPRAAIIVSLFRPSGGQYYGGTVAAPCAGEILADAMQYMKVPPEPGVKVAGDGPGGD